MKSKELYNYRNITNLKYKQLSTSRQMNQLAMEGKKPLMVVYLKENSGQAGICVLLFFLVLFVCCFVSSSPSSNKLCPRESYLTNLLQTHNLQVPTHTYISHSLKTSINSQNTIVQQLFILSTTLKNNKNIFQRSFLIWAF